MENESYIGPIIYRLPTSDIHLKLDPDHAQFDNQPNPKLIKYGFNNITDSLDLVRLMNNAHYKTGLYIDFDRTDAGSMSVLGKKAFGVPNSDADFCTLWEILQLFGMLNQKQTILTTQSSQIKNIVSSHQKLSKNKSKIEIYDTLPTNEKFTIAIRKYSDIDLSEDAIIQLLIDDLSGLIPNKAETGSSLIVQVMSCQTCIMSEIIYYLSTLYQEAYIIKPLASSLLSDEKYLVLCGLKKGIKKFGIEKFSSKTYLTGLGITLPDDYVRMIQCLNSELIPKKFNNYCIITEYLANKNYEGASYQELYEKQNTNIKNFITTMTDFGNIENILKQSLAITDTACNIQNNWSTVFN